MSDLGNKEIMAQNLQRLMDSRGIDRNKLCADLGFKYTTLTDWLKGNTYPRIDKIEMMAWHLKFTHKTYKYSNYLARLLAYLFIFHYIFI